MAVGWLGNRASNDLQWRNVYSKDGGEYTLRVYFVTGEDRTMKLSVNGGEAIVYTGNSGGWSTVGSAEFNVVLENNSVRQNNDLLTALCANRILNEQINVSVQEWFATFKLQFKFAIVLVNNLLVSFKWHFR